MSARWGSAVICAVLLSIPVGLIYYATFGGPDAHNPVVTRAEYGTVLSVDNCNAGKYSYRCTVRTNLGAYHDMDVSDFPGEGVSIGDVLFIQRVNDGREQKSSLCKNNSCVLNGGCYWWMPCWGRR